MHWWVGGTELFNLGFRATKLLYPFFWAVITESRLTKITGAAAPAETADFPKLRTVLEELDDLIEEVKDGTRKPTDEQRKFYDAQAVHWVHASNRTFLTQYICRQFVAALS